MNHVFLSGVAESAAQLVSKENETPHAVLQLTVSHKTAAGALKQERYPVSAWRGTAQRLAQLTRPGSHLSVKGYLSQRVTPGGILLEVTAEEFQVSGGAIGYAPISWVPQKAAAQPDRESAALHALRQAVILSDEAEENRPGKNAAPKPVNTISAEPAVTDQASA